MCVCASVVIVGFYILIQFQDKGKWSALHVAAKYNRIAIAEHLIEAGANLEALTDRMVTPMHVACKEGSVEFIELLIKHFKKQTNKDVNEVRNVCFLVVFTKAAK